MTLRDAAVGSTVVVSKITGDPAYKRRIMDMGITKGSEVYIRKVAPLGDPAVLIASSEKAKNILGWKPEHADLEEIIASAWKWHSSHPQGYCSVQKEDK